MNQVKRVQIDYFSSQLEIYLARYNAIIFWFKLFTKKQQHKKTISHQPCLKFSFKFSLIFRLWPNVVDEKKKRKIFEAQLNAVLWIDYRKFDFDLSASSLVCAKINEIISFPVFRSVC